MRVLSVYGGIPLHGETTVQGAKNSVLPILAATVLAGGPCVIHNCPHLSDVDTAMEILRWLGATVLRENETILVDPSGIERCTIPAQMMQKMRSSVLFLGSILARCGQAEISVPGGCRLGARPIDFHLEAMRTFGAEVKQQGEQIRCMAHKMPGGRYRMPFASVGATENSMLAAMGCTGEVVLENAAREPEIVDLASFLCAMGAEVHGAGSSTIVLRPGTLHGAVHRVIPDRIAAVTYLCAAASAGGEIILRRTNPKHYEAVLKVLQQAGCEIQTVADQVLLRRNGPLYAPGYIETGPYPAFPTDAQSPVMAALLRAEGTTRIRETVFSNRFQQIPELEKLGAEITVAADLAQITTARHLVGAPMRATDLRGGAALVVAALAAEGESEIRGLEHIDRGYASIEQDLRELGAEIVRRQTRVLQKS